jgi:sec-independent protein translocase protein TatC
MFIAFGITFEVPIAVVLLVKMGVISVEKLKDIRPYVVVGAFVVGAVLTPPDVVSQLMLAFPLWLLYEVGILAAGMLSKPQPAEDAHRAPGAAELEREQNEVEGGRKKD